MRFFLNKMVSLCDTHYGSFNKFVKFVKKKWPGFKGLGHQTWPHSLNLANYWLCQQMRMIRNVWHTLCTVPWCMSVWTGMAVHRTEMVKQNIFFQEWMVTHHASRFATIELYYYCHQRFYFCQYHIETPTTVYFTNAWCDLLGHDCRIP
jgi:hypothetical protein